MGSALFNIPTNLSHHSVSGNSQNPFISSDDIMLKMPAGKSFQDVFYHNRIPVNQPSDGNPLHIAEATVHFAEAAEGIAEAAEGIVEAAEGIVEATKEIAEAAEGIAEATEEIAEAAEGIVEAAEGTVKATEGIVEAAEGNVKATEYIIVKNNSTNILSRFVKHSINN
jgi:hypothetical protein